MHSVSAKQVRHDFTNISCDVAFKKERYVVTKNGHDFMAMVPLEDLELIRAIEDRIDNEAAEKSEKYIEKHGTISWNEMERRLGINSE